VADVTVKRVEDFEDIDTLFDGSMKKARAGLGVRSFGMQVIDMEPHQDAYPEHDHADSGAEEVYVVLEGAAILRAAGQEHPLEPGTMARVGPGERRKLLTGPSRARILALGGTPGRAFVAPAFSVESQPR
jgi:mannose-6-phosphate isomerase-like protein (cupin superfamily)